ncbi:unnamed protein product [Mytilus edulis]|uniref:RNA-directed DNA polymerase n=2 Tax=Mytilus edulis TaxID=6550 RepID=A0A8S3S205_MYTED|nr:unnamed protein product [Mytilus edulis]
MFDQARTLDLAQRSNEVYVQPFSVTAAIGQKSDESVPDSTTKLQFVTEEDKITAAAAQRPGSKQKCFFCGNNAHARRFCPAKDASCHNCSKKGHFSKVCKSNTTSTGTSASCTPILATVTAASPQCLKKAVINVRVNERPCKALIDTGSSESFIDRQFAKLMSVNINDATGSVSMASSALSSPIVGICKVNLNIDGHFYRNMQLSVLNKLCCDIILGQDFMKRHDSIKISFGGSRPAVENNDSNTVCGLAASSVDPPELFATLTSECRPIATKSRKYSAVDREFIEKETTRLLTEGIIEPSMSPWRAQVLVTSNERHKKRLVIDYSQTINRFTELDAYPFPNINQMVSDIAKYKVYSTLDLRSAYHQIPLREHEKKYTAFEANGSLYQFRRVPFGVTNGVACFQRVIDRLVAENKLEAVFVYIDNITIGGMDQTEHDENLRRFLDVADKHQLTFNEDKCVYSVESVDLLGYTISQGVLRPDPDRMKPLRELPVPHSPKSVKRAMGMFSYYSQWIPRFSDKIKPLANATSFPLDSIAVKAFDDLKSDLENASISAIDEAIPFETDASDSAVAGSLNQGGRPVAFFSRTLNAHELGHSSVEKEACAIIDAVRKWRHLLSGKHFTLVTDQEAVSYMFDSKKHGKVKNDKIIRWRTELSCYSYDIKYRPGQDNASADCFSRAYCSSISSDSLSELHSALCHPGINRLLHFVRSKNLPFSVDDVKRTIKQCEICAKVKPQYAKPNASPLVKATQPFERLSIDFKGPLPSVSTKKYILTVVDEYSRFPFAFPCSDMTSATVIQCLRQLFALFGMPAYIHSDRGQSFMSAELKTFLQSHGVATSRTTPYSPQSNGQCERYNGIIWKAVTLALESLGLKETQWESVLPDALHSVRSLLCTSINCTPHERFFNFTRRSSSGQSIPSWLANPGPILMKKHVRATKYDPLVEEVDLLEANPTYAHVRLPDGRETTVSVRHLAPRGQSISNDNLDHSVLNDHTTMDISETDVENTTQEATNNTDNTMETSPVIRRSTREVKKPSRFGFDD